MLGAPQTVLTKVSAVPPTVMWVLKTATSPGLVPAMFTWRMVAPWRTSATVKRISWISAIPVSPGLPTITTGLGLALFQKLLPVPEMTDLGTEVSSCVERGCGFLPCLANDS